MAVEIERKFLVAEGWRDHPAQRVAMRQGYLGGARCSIRVRIAGARAQLNIKSREAGARRLEFEYDIPLADAREILDCLSEGALVEKTRHTLEYRGHTWEVDEFEGANSGLIVAEVELADEAERFERPPWLGREVTGERRYYNDALARCPFLDWSNPTED